MKTRKWENLLGMLDSVAEGVTDWTPARRRCYEEAVRILKAEDRAAAKRLDRGAGFR